MYKYFIEYLGVLIIVTAKLLTHINPAVMGLLYFSVYWITKDITTGYFTIWVPISDYILNRSNNQDITYNLVAQILGGLSAIILFKPLKAYID